MNMLFPMAAVAVILGGCAATPTKLVDQTSAAAMRGQTLAQTSRPIPKFGIMTRGDGLAVATGGLIGALFANAATRGHADSPTGRGMVPDPAEHIARELADALEARNGMLKAGGSLSVEHDVTVPQIVSAARGRSNYVLDVKTFSWSTAYFPMSLSKYNIHYHAQGWLINADTGAVVASGTCKDLPDNIDTAPTYDQMMANDGAVLKQLLAVEAAACVATLKREMLAL